MQKKKNENLWVGYTKRATIYSLALSPILSISLSLSLHHCLIEHSQNATLSLSKPTKISSNISLIFSYNHRSLPNITKPSTIWLNSTAQNPITIRISGEESDQCWIEASNGRHLTSPNPLSLSSLRFGFFLKKKIKDFECSWMIKYGC